MESLITSLRMRTPLLEAWQATNSQLTRFIPSLKDVTSATSKQERVNKNILSANLPLNIAFYTTVWKK